MPSSSSAPQHKSPDTSDADTSFGISNRFSGKLSDDQERGVPEALRGAYLVEAIQRVSAGEFSQQTKGKTQLAEERRGKNRYVAVRDYRSVSFGNGSSGMMIVVERYYVIDD